MLAQIKEILVITTPLDHEQFKKVLGDGSQWGIKLEYKVQPSPDGLAQAFILAEEFLDGAPSAMVLGDNIFFGVGLSEVLARADINSAGATIFGYHVTDPGRYGVLGFDSGGAVDSIEEKPEFPRSNYAITGLYFVDHTASERAKLVKPSKRGEIEITSLLDSYLTENNINVEKLGRGFAWLDTGTHSSLLDASNFVRTLTDRQGLQVGSPDEVAFRNGWIDEAEVRRSAEILSNSEYGKALKQLISKSY
jgi:glucose-1-phosphate thymidylyltransferase